MNTIDKDTHFNNLIFALGLICLISILSPDSKSSAEGVQLSKKEVVSVNCIFP